MLKTDQKKIKHNTLRLLKLLSKKVSSGFDYSDTQTCFIILNNDRSYRFSKEIITTSAQELLISLDAQKISITLIGLEKLKPVMNMDITDEKPGRKLILETAYVNGSEQKVKRNIYESPLHRLYTKPTKSGAPYISHLEFMAGEKLRNDFERGQLQPKISSTWGNSTGSSNKNGAMEISDFALDARTRLNRAIEKIGPELSGVALDICCFLKGLEAVERERHWPARSAKLMLKTSLSLLARHYGFAGYENSKTGKITTWATDNYRPNLQLQAW